MTIINYLILHFFYLNRQIGYIFVTDRNIAFSGTTVTMLPVELGETSCKFGSLPVDKKC